MYRLYSRVSTTGQDLDSQHQELTTWIKDKPHELYDDKFTGKSMKRPAIEKLLKEAKAGDTLVVVRLDRLGRTAAGLTQLFNELTERKINFVSINDSIDLSTTSGRLVANVLASVAQFETEVRRDRIMSGVAAKKARGEEWGNGRPKGSYSYTEEDIEAVKTLRAAKVPVATIVKRTKLSRATIYNMLARIEA